MGSNADFGCHWHEIERTGTLADDKHASGVGDQGDTIVSDKAFDIRMVP
jgi:hypothetical protein